MPLVPMRQMLDEAAKGGYGVGAFNVNNMEQIQAIMEAAKETRSPVVVQASRGARKYSNDKFLYHLMLAAAELYPETPMALHLDHGNGFETCQSAIALGFTSVMIDGSLLEDGKTPSDFKYNVELTRKVVDFAHERGVSVEGEIGTLGGIEDGHGAGGSGLEHLTDPDQAVEFVEKTGVDALAVAIGTSHGAYKFASKPTEAVLKISLIRKIHQLLPTTHLVMHGSSSVPQELRDQVNKYGGNLKPAWGVPVEEIQEGIRNGVRKVNVDTDCRLAVIGVVRRVLAERPDCVEPRDFLRPAREAMQKVVAQRMRQFGQAGHASDCRPRTLEDMRALYAGARDEPPGAAEARGPGGALPENAPQGAPSPPG
jgi:fructose-bisphosphate aldolase class II